MVNVCEIERPRNVPGHDTMDDYRGQHPKTHGLGHGGLVLPDGLGPLADISKPAPGTAIDSEGRVLFEALSWPITPDW